MYDHIREKIQSIIRNKNLTIGDQEPLLTSGILSSLNVIELIAWLEENYHIDFSAGDFNVYDFETLQSIVSLINKTQKTL